jgi:hypothetical protein
VLCCTLVHCSESFLEDQDMKLVCLGEQDESAQRGAKNHMIAEETVIEALSYLVDSLHYPVLVMCSTGKHRTGKQLVPSSWLELPP